MAKILICDDNAFMRKTLSTILKEGDHEVVGEAGDGREAIELFEKTTPDLVIMDITMPFMDGLQALKEILFIDPKAKVIMCSALGNQKTVIEAIRFGAKDFIIKPPVPQKVLEIVGKYV